jgi:hypothetical protein
MPSRLEIDGFGVLSTAPNLLNRSAARRHERMLVARESTMLHFFPSFIGVRLRHRVAARMNRMCGGCSRLPRRAPTPHGSDILQLATP